MEELPDLSISIECRDLRHAWERHGTDAVLLQQEGQVRHFARHLHCLRCGTLRIDEYRISRIAIVRVRSRYQYPDGYQVNGGLTVAKARFLLFRDMEMVAEEEVRAE